MLSPRICPNCISIKNSAVPLPHDCSRCGGSGSIAATRDYIEGAKARATKQDFRFVNDEWTAGFNDMTNLLSPIETDIIKLTFRYQTVACGYVRELEDSFREEPEAG